MEEEEERRSITNASSQTERSLAEKKHNNKALI
jgi:hypothetical protein